MRTVNTLIGQPMERTEDLRLLRGKGTYVGDIVREGMLHAVIVRSQVAHGRIRGIDATAALALPGVHAVITAKDLGAHDAARAAAPAAAAAARAVPPADAGARQGALRRRARGGRRRRHARRSRRTRTISSRSTSSRCRRSPTGRAAEAPAALLFDEHGSNAALTWHATKGDAAKAFADAPYTRKERFTIQRHAAMFMEPRGFVAEWDACGHSA